MPLFFVLFFSFFFSCKEFLGLLYNIFFFSVALLDLSIKNCVPCDSKDLRPMTPEAANELITKVLPSI